MTHTLNSTEKIIIEEPLLDLLDFERFTNAKNGSLRDLTDTLGIRGFQNHHVERVREECLNKLIEKRRIITHLIFLPQSRTATQVVLGCQSRGCKISGDCKNGCKITNDLLNKYICPWVSGIRSLKRLDLSHNSFDNLSQENFCRALRNSKSQLVEFNISHNRLGNAFVAAICLSLERFSLLTHLNIAATGVASFDGDNAIASLICHCKNLEVVILHDLCLGNSATSVCEALGNCRNLQKVDISCCDIAEAGAVLKMIRNCKSLLSLIIFGNRWNESEYALILSCVSCSFSLRTLVTDDMNISPTILEWSICRHSSLRQIIFVQKDFLSNSLPISRSVRSLLSSFASSNFTQVVRLSKSAWAAIVCDSREDVFHFEGVRLPLANPQIISLPIYDHDEIVFLKSKKFGSPSPTFISAISPSDAVMRELDYRGTFLYCYDKQNLFSLLPSSFPNLKSLCLTKCSLISTSFLKREQFPSLEYLDLSGNPNVILDCTSILESISIIRLANCEMTKWPRFSSTTINTVIMNGNPISSVPDITSLPNVQFLMAFFCPFLSQIENIYFVRDCDPFVLCLLVKQKQANPAAFPTSLWGEDAAAFLSLMSKSGYYEDQLSEREKKIMSIPGIFSQLFTRISPSLMLGFLNCSVTVGADVNEKLHNQETPLTFAFNNNDLDLFRTLLSIPHYQAKLQESPHAFVYQSPLPSFWLTIFEKFRDEPYSFIASVYRCNPPFPKEFPNIRLGETQMKTLLSAEAMAGICSLKHFGLWETLLTNPPSFCKYLKRDETEASLDLSFLENCLDELESNGISITALSKSLTKNRRRLIDVSIPEYMAALSKRTRFCRKYELHEGHPVHLSSTSIVLKASEIHTFESDFHQFKSSNVSRSEVIGYLKKKGHLTLESADKILDYICPYKDTFTELEFVNDICLRLFNRTSPVALKFMKNADQFRKEIGFRTAHSLSADFILSGAQDPPSDKEFKKAAEAENLAKHWNIILPAPLQLSAYSNVFAMPFAERNLLEIYQKERLKVDDIRIIVKKVALALKHLHSKKIIHGDLRMLNVVRWEGKILLIDLDASVYMSDTEPSYAGAKFSSGILPPEMFQVLDDEQLKRYDQYWKGSDAELLSKISAKCFGKSQHYVVKSFKIVDNHPVVDGLPYTLMMASVDLDLWAFAMMLFWLLSRKPYFFVDRDDDMSCAEGMHECANLNNDDAGEFIDEMITDPAAADLLKRMIKRSPDQRLKSIDEVLSHAFFRNEPQTKDTSYQRNEIEAILELTRALKENTASTAELNRNIIGMQETFKASQNVLLKAILDINDVRVPSSILIRDSVITPDDYEILYEGKNAEFKRLSKEEYQVLYDKRSPNSSALQKVCRSLFQRAAEIVQAPSTAKKSLVDLFQKDKILYLYLIDEYTGLPVIDIRNVFPLPITEPAEFIPKIMPLLKISLKAAWILAGAASVAACFGLPIPHINAKTLERFESEVGSLDQSSSVSEYEVLQQMVDNVPAEGSSEEDKKRIRYAPLRELELFFEQFGVKTYYCGMARLYVNETLCWTLATYEQIAAYEKKNGKNEINHNSNVVNEDRAFETSLMQNELKN